MEKGTVKTAALWPSSAICGGLPFSQAGLTAETAWKAGESELICLHGGLRFHYIGRMAKNFRADLGFCELQTEIPVQKGKSGTNRIKQHRESDDTKAGGAEMFFLFLCGNRTAGGERRKNGKVFEL